MELIRIMRENPTICVVGAVEESSSAALRERLKAMVAERKDEPISPQVAAVVNGK